MIYTRSRLLIFFPIRVLSSVGIISILLIHRVDKYFFSLFNCHVLYCKRCYTDFFSFNLILFLKRLYFLRVSVRSAQRPRSVSRHHYYYGETCVGRDRSCTISLSLRVCHILLSQHGQPYHFKLTNGYIHSLGVQLYRNKIHKRYIIICIIIRTHLTLSLLKINKLLLHKNVPIYYVYVPIFQYGKIINYRGDSDEYRK